MKKLVLTLTTSESMLACGAIAANAQQNTSTSMMQQPKQTTYRASRHKEGAGMGGEGGMMGHRMMGPSRHDVLWKHGTAFCHAHHLCPDGWIAMVTGPSHFRNFRPLRKKSSRQWMQTKMACSHLKRYRLSSGEPANRPRNAKMNPSNNKKEEERLIAVYSFKVPKG